MSIYLANNLFIYLFCEQYWGQMLHHDFVSQNKKIHRYLLLFKK